MATQKMVISWLEDIIPEIKRTRDPEGVMLKYAREKNLAPAQLEKLAQVYNSAKTINFLEKSANRGGSFHVVDAAELVRKYETPAEKKASIEWEPASDTFRFPTIAVKSASEAEEHSVQPDTKRATIRNYLRDRENLKRNVEVYEAVVSDTRADLTEKVAALVTRIRTFPDFDFQSVEADVLYSNSFAKEACDIIAARLPKVVNVKRASDAGKKRLIADRSGFVADFLEVQELIGVAKSAQTLREDFLKEAGASDVDTDTQTGRGSDTSMASSDPQLAKRKPAGKPGNPPPQASGSSSGGSGKGLNDELASLIQGIESPKFPGDPAGMVGNMISDVLGGRKNKGQEHVDTEMDDEISRVVIERLMFTDPIISEADPQQVISLANSIRARSPELARDVNAMRAQLREQLQYDSMPANTSKDLAGIQKTLNENNQSAREQSRDKYSLGGTRTFGTTKA